MTDGLVPPAGVGPHEGRELELMLAGEKPLAMFEKISGASDRYPEADFSPYVADGSIVLREVTYRTEGSGPPCSYLYYARVGEEWRIEAMQKIHARIFIQEMGTSHEVERQIGRLLGYADADIEQYIAWFGECMARLRNS